MSKNEVSQKDAKVEPTIEEVFKELFSDDKNDVGEISVLSKLIKVQERLDKAVNEERSNAIDRHFEDLLEILHLNNISVGQYFEQAEKRYEQNHGEKPITLRHADISFTETGKRRSIPAKYKGIGANDIWTGRGKMPIWMVEEISKHNLKKEDFLINSKGERTAKLNAIINSEAQKTESGELGTA